MKAKLIETPEGLTIEFSDGQKLAFSGNFAMHLENALMLYRHQMRFHGHFGEMDISED